MSEEAPSPETEKIPVPGESFEFERYVFVPREVPTGLATIEAVWRSDDIGISITKAQKGWSAFTHGDAETPSESITTLNTDSKDAFQKLREYIRRHTH